MIVRVTTTSRPQQRYDHRLRDLVGGELPVAPQKTPERTRDCGNSARPKSVLSQASLGDEDTPGVQSVDVPRGTGAWFEPTSRTGHAAIGV